jgi:hypothetical protein
MTPEEAALERLAAIEALQAELAGHINELQRRLYEGLLLRLQDTYEQPELLPALLAEFTAQVQLPLVVYYGQSLMTLPGLTLDYFESLGFTNYKALRRPLEGYLQQVFGITPAGELVPSGQLALLAGDTTAQRELLRFAYQANTSGLGLTAYRDGLSNLINGMPTADGRTLGLYQKLYKGSFDTYNQADRALQMLSAEELGLQGWLYQGGLVEGSRPFCKSRNGKVFLRPEIAAWKKLKFQGKPDPYDPFTMCGGFNCRHGLHALPSAVAIRLRPELREDAQGRLVIG